MILLMVGEGPGALPPIDRRGTRCLPPTNRRGTRCPSAYLTFSCDSFWSEAAAALAATAYQKMNLMAVTSFLMLGLMAIDRKVLLLYK